MLLKDSGQLGTEARQARTRLVGLRALHIRAPDDQTEEAIFSDSETYKAVARLLGHLQEVGSLCRIAELDNEYRQLLAGVCRAGGGTQPSIDGRSGADSA